MAGPSAGWGSLAIDTSLALVRIIREPPPHSVSEPPTGARRRSPSPRSGVPPANQASPCVRGLEAPALRAALAGRGRDRAPRWAETGRRGVTVRPGAEIRARRRAVAPPGNPLREPHGGAADRAGPDSRAWSARH